MSTNPNNAVGTNAAYGGRTSVKAFNDILGVFSGRGLLSGWAVSPSAGMVVSVGGSGITRDVAIAENNVGDRTTINNISEQPVLITVPDAPTSNSRYDSIVAYVDNPPSGSSTVADNPSAVGIIVVSGSVAGSPTRPDESTIRDAITVDGGTGATAYYVVLASVRVLAGTTDITSNLIVPGQSAVLNSNSMGWSELADYNLAQTATQYVTSINRARLVKYGRLCQIDLNIQVTTPTADAYVLFELPTSLLPIYPTELSSYLTSGETVSRRTAVTPSGIYHRSHATTAYGLLVGGLYFCQGD